MKYLSDTNWLIDLLNARPETIVPGAELLSDELAMSVISYLELLDGVYGSHNPATAEAGFRGFLRAVTVLPFSRRVAERTARLRGQLRAQKRPVNHRALDILIAGTALAYGLILVTSDKDFDDIPGLTTLNPRTWRLVARD